MNRIVRNILWACTAPALLMLLAMSAEAELVYREIFAEGRNINDVEWKIYVDKDARDASGASAVSGAWARESGGLPAVNAGKASDGDVDRGLVYLKEGQEGNPYVFVSDDMKPVQQPLEEISWYMNLKSPEAVVHPVVRIDADGDVKPGSGDRWFVAAQGFRDSQSTEKSLRKSTFDASGATWKAFDFDPGTRSGGGSTPASIDDAKTVGSLPDGAVLAVGFYSPARIDRPNFDTIEVHAAGLADLPATPENIASELIAKRSGQALSSQKIEDRWPQLKTRLEQRGPKQNVEPWNPQLDVPVKGDVYYVHPDLGNDGNDGKSAQQAFRTLP